MGHSQAAKAASRRRILGQAAKDVRRDGPAGLAIAPLMVSAGLTHGAFYSHFESRAELAAEAVQTALDEGEAMFALEESEGLKEMVGRYLSRAHRDNVEEGCGLAAMAGSVHGELSLREIVGRRAQDYKDIIDRIAPEDKNSWVILSTMVGALLLSRLTSEPASSSILRSAKEAILDSEMESATP